MPTDCNLARAMTTSASSARFTGGEGLEREHVYISDSYSFQQPIPVNYHPRTTDSQARDDLTPTSLELSTLKRLNSLRQLSVGHFLAFDVSSSNGRTSPGQDLQG
jgi:hypothetical protein